MTDLETSVFNTLYEKYGTMLLSIKQTAETLGTSKATLDRDRYAGKGLEYQQTGASSVKYPLHVVVKSITENTIKTA